MKELSIEEKAKAYDNAKARMSKAYNSNRCTIGFMNEIFPELKESEDEKIKRVIKQVLYESTTEKDECYLDNGVTQHEVFAWLEKQGEQKHVFPKFRVGDTVKAKTMDNFMFTIKDITDKQYVDTNGGKYDIEGQDYLELVEQKPAWSEEDETGLTNNIIMLKEGASLHFNKKDITKAVDWLKSLKERVQPQLKQEWRDRHCYISENAILHCTP